MELSQLKFKVYHKPGPSLGHVDGLSRLRSASVCAITIDDLLNADEAQDESAPMISEGIEQPTVPGSESTYPAPSVSSASVGESLTHVLPTEPMAYPENIPMAASDLAGEPSALTETSEEVGEGFEEKGPVDKMERSFTSVEEFGLNQEKFVEEQKVSPWICAMRAFIEDGALVLDPHLRTKVLMTTPNYDMENGILMRRVHLRATAGPVITITVPVIPLPFIETVLHYLHRVPERLLSDRGSNFTSDLARWFHETLGIKKLFGAAYHPQTQGLVERFNGTLRGMLKIRPFADEVPGGVSNSEVGEEGPLLQDDLPPSSFAEDRRFGGNELVVTGVDEAIVDILVRRVEKRALQYVVLTANYKTAWMACSKLEPYYKKLVDAFEDSHRETEGLLSLRRSTRLADANAVVDDEDFRF
ncbi:unnamed protein product [Phytophthora fragariaefolia]|uniref:Unnamed protein product n=1 Tax=Phytophthora fragariaefolia TaxID=1490495 RepID=A0A9W7CXD8_9STRA|nr:unnamed protein product [Phytophthora fragariaefolia]